MTIRLPKGRGKKSVDRNDIKIMGKEYVKIDSSQKKGTFPLG
jgi:hypothetical protein